MPSRSEIHKTEATQEFIANALAVLNLCKDKGMTDEEALEFSKTGLEFKYFEWLYDKTKGDIKFMRNSVAKRLAKIEYNRVKSMFITAESMGITKEQSITAGTSPAACSTRWEH